MELLSDVRHGAWLRDRVGAWGRVGGVAGRGLDAYVRILHPAPAVHVDWSVSDEQGAPSVLEEARWPWTEVAARQGLTMRSLVQWNRLADMDGNTEYADGWQVGQTQEGTSTSTCSRTSRGTSLGRRPHRVISWPPCGTAGESSATTARSGTSRREVAWSTGSPAGVPDSGRGLLSGSCSRAWVVASEIDWDRTIVAGSRVLVEHVLADERFEAFGVGEDADLTYEGDTVNPPRAGWSAAP